jgi:spore coat polysaccharide biosynthesis predicted glycosyltransferase SpsG
MNFSPRRILIRVDGSKEIGLGHVYNMITVLHSFKKDSLLIVMQKNSKLGANKFLKFNIPVKYFNEMESLEKIIKKFKPEIIFNDTLNTNKNYTKKLKNLCPILINFEDLGAGRKNADLVFNPIYYDKNSAREFYGHKFACVRDEFRVSKIPKIKKNVKKIAITFGGTDPTDKTFHVLSTLKKHNLYKIQVNIILGLGYTKKSHLHKLITSMRDIGFTINLVEKSDNIAKFIRNCDFVITSNGRTVFEIAAMKIPMIAIAVNERERKHSFVARTKSGFQINTSSKYIDNVLDEYIFKILDKKTREYFLKKLIKNDILSGLPLVVNKINKKYYDYSQINTKFS